MKYLKEEEKNPRTTLQSTERLDLKLSDRKYHNLQDNKKNEKITIGPAHKKMGTIFGTFSLFFSFLALERKRVKKNLFSSFFACCKLEPVAATKLFSPGSHQKTFCKLSSDMIKRQGSPPTFSISVSFLESQKMQVFFIPLPQ